MDFYEGLVGEKGLDEILDGVNKEETEIVKIERDDSVVVKMEDESSVRASNLETSLEIGKIFLGVPAGVYFFPTLARRVYEKSGRLKEDNGKMSEDEMANFFVSVATVATFAAGINILGGIIVGLEKEYVISAALSPYATNLLSAVYESFRYVKNSISEEKRGGGKDGVL